ncbi:MAG: VWA domain-containing protein, partial [Planctomycetales bacterium]|nr:VWA domain-containing protein [Planctomycetales bacterium]NIO46232.1 VWA domain-containing protein [Planctomycetales bacterium]NIP69131.1 VWA domain-containing protein [Planctomycetales bacterium]
MDNFRTPDGEGYFVLSIRPQITGQSERPSDLVIMVDTSASQVGQHRTAALTALNAMLAKLAVQDRVMLMAVDVTCVPLTEGFVSAGSQALGEAVDTLQRRTPLGSTDMAQAMSEAAAVYGAADGRRRAVVYLGDGMSRTRLVGNTNFEDLVKRLVEKRISVTSYAVGPETDNELLAILANYTGGQLVLDSKELDLSQVGKYLATAATAPVIWPSNLRLSEKLTEIYPAVMPPLRGDRETIVFGKGDGSGRLDIRFVAEVDGSSVEVVAEATGSPAEDENSYLAGLVRVAKKGGHVPTLGTRGLVLTKQMVRDGVYQLNRLSKNALASGNFSAAGRLAEVALQTDPVNNDAEVIRGAAQRGLIEDAVGGGEALNDEDDALFEDAIAASGGAIDAEQRQRQVYADVVKVDVQKRLEEARRQMADDPESVESDLKMLLADLLDETEVDADVLDQLKNQVRTAIREAGRRKYRRAEQQRERMDTVAATTARQRALDEAQRRRDRVAVFMERFHSLMIERRYAEAEKAATRAFRIEPDDPAVTAASIVSNFKENYEDYVATLEARNRGFVDTLNLVQKAAIPFAGEPPMVYPPQAEWEKLTRRREKYGEVDLKEKKPAEKKILEELDKPTLMDFEETPLVEVIEYLEDLHGIEIQLATNALEEFNIDTDTPVTIDVRGISLRSALRLMLDSLEPDLTYSINNEVLMLTTREAAEENLVTKVYPVADLVLPVVLSGFAGSGGFGGAGAQTGFGG